MRFFKEIIVVFSLALCVSAINYSDCGSSGKVLNVNVQDCGDADKCPLVRGQTASLDIDFQVNKKVEKLRPVVHGEVMGLFLPFMPPKRNACEESGLSCPLSPDEDYKYHAEIPLKSFYPTLDVPVRYQLKDGADTIVCVLIQCTIV